MPHWALGQQFGHLMGRMATLTAAFCNLAMGSKDAMHRSSGTQTAAFAKQGGWSSAGP